MQQERHQESQQGNWLCSSGGTRNGKDPIVPLVEGQGLVLGATAPSAVAASNRWLSLQHQNQLMQQQYQLQNITQQQLPNGLCQPCNPTQVPTPMTHYPNRMNPPERPGSALSFLSIGDSQHLQFQEEDKYYNDNDAGHSLSIDGNDHNIEDSRENENINQNIPRCLNIRDWIKKAKMLSKDGRITTSHSYMICSLKIALSLADQICKLEKEQYEGGSENKTEGGSAESNPTHDIPPPGMQWSEYITVHLNASNHLGDSEKSNHNNSHEEEANPPEKNGAPGLQPVEGSQTSQEESAPNDGDDLIVDLLPEIFVGIREEGEHGQVDLSNHLPSGARNFDLLPEILKGGKEDCHHEGNNSKCHSPDLGYLNISSANLQLEKHGTNPSNTCPSKEDKMMYIYYLGLVFSELISGGECCINEGKLGTDPLYDSRPIDVGNAMNILDSLGDDDELFGGCKNSDIKFLDESAYSEYRRDDFNKSNKKTAASALPESSFITEQLKSLRLPNALCDSVANMINCSQGDFRGDETYSSMADVRTDLRLMLENPDVYLHDIDLDEVSKVGLQMDDRTATWYGRDSELASLKEMYRDSLSGTCKAAIICGHHGIGKSLLAHEFVQHAQSVADDESNARKGCIMLTGKFDKLQQSHTSSPIASAFNEYCEWLSSCGENTFMVEEVSNALKRALGHEAYALVKVIPNLSKIIDGEEDKIEKGDDVEDAQKRLGYLFSQLTQVIIQSHDAPLVLYIDNLQWADQSSIALIKHILLASLSNVGGKASNRNQFFFLGCFNDEMDDIKDDPIWTMLDSVKDFGLNTTKIELGCLDKETVNTMISKKLNLLPRLTRPLTDIVHHKTKGNPFFVRRLMIELSKEGLLRPSLSRCRWEWEEEKIQERGLPDDFVSFLTASLNRLPSQVLLALCTLSCFGSCADQILAGLEKELGRPLVEPLDNAVLEGFLYKKDDKYHFVDDRVEKAAYNLIKPEERCLHHFNYGMKLCSLAEKNDDDGLFLIAVGQVNLGGPKAAVDDKERLTVTKHNLSAGKKAMAMSDFVSAYWFFDNGISFLKKNHWEDHYELSLELFNGAAECALMSGEHESLSILSEQIMRFAKCMEDKHQIFFISVRLLFRRSNIPAAIECGINALSTLGEDFPVNASPDLVIHLLEQTKEMLEGMQDEDLINHKLMTNSNKIQAMKFLAKLSEPLYIVRPSDQPIVVLKMVQLSLEYGMSPISPLAFVSYGSFLASMGDIREGYRYARLAKVLLNKVGSRQVTGEVIAYFAQLMAYAEPVQSAIEFHIEGEKAGMTSGATIYAMLNALLYDSCSYWSGKNLRAVKSQLDKTLSQMKQHNSLLLLVQLMPLYGSVTRMIGRENSRGANPETEAGSGSMVDTEKLECDLREKNPFQSKPHYFNKMYTAFIFRKYDDMKIALEKFSGFKIGAWIFVYSSSIQIFYEGLISFWVGRKERDNTFIEKGKDCCRAIEKLVESASEWNFENKAKLLQAEEQLCDGNFDLAESLYDSAVFSAKEHRFVNEEALANELTGEFFLERNRKDQAKVCFSHAVEKYSEWGAVAKAEDLKKKIQDLENSEYDLQGLISTEESRFFEGMGAF